MAISNNKVDRIKQAYKENAIDGGIDQRNCDITTHAKLEDIKGALGVGTGAAVNTYSEVSSVATSTPTTVVTYIAPVGKTSYLQLAEVSGTNIAEYELKINGTTQAKKRTYFGGKLNVTFDFEVQGARGLNLSVGDTITIVVTHSRSMTGDFEARIQSFEV